MRRLLDFLLVLVVHLTKLARDDLSYQAAAQDIAASDDCLQASCNPITKDHILLQLGHGHHVSPKRETAPEAAKFASHVVPSLEGNVSFEPGAPDWVESNGTEIGEALDEVTSAHGADHDDEFLQESGDIDTFRARRQLNSNASRVEPVTTGRLATATLASLFAVAAQRLQTFKVSYPVYALVGILALTVMAVAFVAFIALQADGPPRQELPRTSGSPPPRLLGRFDPSPRQLPKRKNPQASNQDAQRTNASLAMSGEGLQREHRRPSRSSSKSGDAYLAEPMLCPRLLVPEGMELVFKVPDLVMGGRQRASFCVEDMDGNAMSDVEIDETDPSSRCGIFLHFLDKSQLAHVKTALHHQTPCLHLPEICSADGESFGCFRRTSVCSADGFATQYVLQKRSGEGLFAFKGNFQEKAITVVHASGRLACSTRRCPPSSTSRYDSYYEVRVASGVDAGLMLCGLLVMDKVEGTANEL